MMRFTIKVEFEDGTEAAAVASVPDFLAFERKFDKPITEFGQGMRLDWVLWLAWHSLKRAGRAGDDYEAWAANVANLAVGDPEGDAIPPLESSPAIGR